MTAARTGQRRGGSGAASPHGADVNAQRRHARPDGADVGGGAEQRRRRCALLVERRRRLNVRTRARPHGRAETRRDRRAGAGHELRGGRVAVSEPRRRPASRRCCSPCAPAASRRSALLDAGANVNDTLSDGDERAGRRDRQRALGAGRSAARSRRRSEPRRRRVERAASGRPHRRPNIGFGTPGPDPDRDARQHRRHQEDDRAGASTSTPA